MIYIGSVIHDDDSLSFRAIVTSSRTRCTRCYTKIAKQDGDYCADSLENDYKDIFFHIKFDIYFCKYKKYISLCKEQSNNFYEVDCFVIGTRKAMAQGFRTEAPLCKLLIINELHVVKIFY